MVSSTSSEHQAVVKDMLREARLAANLTQAEIARRLGCTQSDISKVERGVRSIDVLELRQWLSAIGVPFQRFIKELDTRLTASEALATRWSRGARKLRRPRKPS